MSGHAPLLSSLVSPAEKAKVVFALSDDDITLTQSPYVMQLFLCDWANDAMNTVNRGIAQPDKRGLTSSLFFDPILLNF